MMPPPRRAQAVDAPADLPLARQLLAQANRHLASAAIPGVDLDSRFGMLYDAARKGADALMRAAGRRITQGIGHHIVFFEEATTTTATRGRQQACGACRRCTKHPQRDGIPSTRSHSD